MRKHNIPRHQRRIILAIIVLATLAVVATDARQERPTGQGFTFRTAVELINVTVTVTDAQGRFVPNLRAEDFTIFEEGQPQTISQFDSERVPVSLGIALDTSGSMVGDKIVAARAALDRFLFDLLGANDEVFLYRFDSRPQLVQSWTEDRREVSRALGNVKPVGGTAIYDTVAEAVPLAARGTRRKKAIVVISGGMPPSRVISTVINPSTRAPTTEPSTYPYAPVSTVPPMTAAAIASSSHPTPVMFCAVPRRAVYSTAARPDRLPLIT